MVPTTLPSRSYALRAISETFQSPRSIICEAGSVFYPTGEYGETLGIRGNATNLVSRHKISDEQEDGHDDMFCDGDDVGAGDLHYGQMKKQS